MTECATSRQGRTAWGPELWTVREPPALVSDCRGHIWAVQSLAQLAFLLSACFLVSTADAEMQPSACLQIPRFLPCLALGFPSCCRVLQKARVRALVLSPTTQWLPGNISLNDIARDAVLLILPEQGRSKSLSPHTCPRTDCGKHRSVFLPFLYPSATSSADRCHGCSMGQTPLRYTDPGIENNLGGSAGQTRRQGLIS